MTEPPTIHILPASRRPDPDTRAAIQPDTARAVLSPVPSVAELALFSLRAQIGMLTPMDRLAAWAEIRRQANREIAGLSSAMASGNGGADSLADVDLLAEQDASIRAIMAHPDPDGDVEPAPREPLTIIDIPGKQWTGDDLRYAFVIGAKWWEQESTGGTMWQSDRNRAEDAAELRYPGGKPRVRLRGPDTEPPALSIGTGQEGDI